MVIQNMPESEVAILKNTLEDLWAMKCVDCAYEGCEDFVDSKDLLITLLSDNINHTISLLSSLDFNKLCEAHVLKFIPDIADNLKSEKDKEALIKFISSLKNTYPSLDLERSLFYTNLL